MRVAVGLGEEGEDGRCWALGSGSARWVCHTRCGSCFGWRLRFVDDVGVVSLGGNWG